MSAKSCSLHNFLLITSNKSRNIITHMRSNNIKAFSSLHDYNVAVGTLVNNQYKDIDSTLAPHKQANTVTDETHWSAFGNQMTCLFSSDVVDYSFMVKLGIATVRNGDLRMPQLVIY